VSEHWRLVAPWYRWDLAAAPDPARADAAGRPAVQKFANTTFVDDFLHDPQASLAYTSDDCVQQVVGIPSLPAFTSGPNKGKKRQFSLLKAVPTETRKVFQPAHQRFYLVAIELHCDVVGFPRVDPAHIAEVGFVIRRRVANVPAKGSRELARDLSTLATRRAIALDQAQLDVARARARSLVPLRSPARSQVVAPRAATLAAYEEVALAKRRIAVWSLNNGVSTDVQGWVPGPIKTVGAWLPSVDEPGVIVETTYPMYRLAPDPNDPDHPANTATIYFGLLPTASADAAEDGTPRFEDAGLYEIRCYAQPIADDDCPQLPVWSEPSAPFSFANFHDPAGCANRPVNIRLPDFAALEAMSARPSVRMSTPAKSHLMFSTSPVPPTSGSVGTDEEICFFAIPLITIVATFLLNLFLPIVLLIFQLWWMLKLKFCIPPSASLSAGVNAELSAIPGGLDAAAGLDIDIDVRVNQANLKEKLRVGLNDTQDGLGDKLTAQLTNNAIVQALLVQGLAHSGTQTYPATLPMEPRVTRDEVVRPQ